jgi:hypothetical protein
VVRGVMAVAYSKHGQSVYTAGPQELMAWSVGFMPLMGLLSGNLNLLERQYLH